MLWRNKNIEKSIVSAFWSDEQGKNKQIIMTKKVAKLIWRFVKIAIYLFMIVLGLWGCVSLYAQPAILESTNIGQGFEFGLPATAQFAGAGAYQYQAVYIGTGTYTAITLGNWTNAYGPFYGYFVYPGCALVILIMWGLRFSWGGCNALLAIIVLLALIRLISIVVSVRSAIMTEKIQELNSQITAIKEKYKGAKDSQSRQMQQQEISQVYKKNNVKQGVMVEQMIITLPVFLIIYRVVTILRPFKYTTLFNIWNLSDSPYNQIFQYFTENGWLYLILLLIVIPIMIISQVLPQMLTKRRKLQGGYNRTQILAEINAKKKSGGLQAAMTWGLPILSVIFAIFLPSGVAIYWVINAIFSIIQSLIVHYFVMRRRHTQKSDVVKRKRLGLDF